MNSKLETLVTALQADDYTKESIDSLILEYYNTPNENEFTLDGVTFEVLTEEEKNDQLDALAERRYEENVQDLRNLCTRYGYRHLEVFMDYLERYDCIKSVRDDLDDADLEEDQDKSFLIADNNYWIYITH